MFPMNKDGMNNVSYKYLTPPKIIKFQLVRVNKHQLSYHHFILEGRRLTHFYSKVQ